MSVSVLVPLFDGFEEIEAIAVIDILRRAGIRVVTASASADKIVKGGQGVSIVADTLLQSAENCDILFLPGGGGGVSRMKQYSSMSDLLSRYSEKPVAAICAAPSVLAMHGLLQGRRVTSYPSVQAEVVTGGAVYSTDSVVTDGQLITSRGAGTAIPFALEIVASVQGRKAARELAEKIVYHFE